LLTHSQGRKPIDTFCFLRRHSVHDVEARCRERTSFFCCEVSELTNIFASMLNL
jgi:hypothetical protein